MSSAHPSLSSGTHGGQLPSPLEATDGPFDLLRISLPLPTVLSSAPVHFRFDSAFVFTHTDVGQAAKCWHGCPGEAASPPMVPPPGPGCSLAALGVSGLLEGSVTVASRAALGNELFSWSHLFVFCVRASFKGRGQVGGACVQEASASPASPSRGRARGRWLLLARGVGTACCRGDRVLVPRRPCSESSSCVARPQSSGPSSEHVVGWQGWRASQRPSRGRDHLPPEPAGGRRPAVTSPSIPGPEAARPWEGTWTPPAAAGRVGVRLLARMGGEGAWKPFVCS